MSFPQVKYDRATAKAAVGKFPGSRDAMWAAIPVDVIGALTSTQLAHLLDAMWGACQEAKRIAEAEVVSNGAVWDARHQRLRELA